MGDKGSKTEKDSFWEERIFGLDHWKTTISDGEGHSVNGRGNTPEESQKVASEKYHKSDSGGSSSGSSSSGCYLTTACVDYFGLPDNCLELTVLRKFRDRILLRDTAGKRMVGEYYHIAPRIVAALNERNDPNLFTQLYSDIRKAVSFVLSSDFRAAFEHYQQMTLGLKNKVLA